MGLLLGRLARDGQSHVSTGYDQTNSLPAAFLRPEGSSTLLSQVRQGIEARITLHLSTTHMKSKTSRLLDTNSRTYGRCGDQSPPL